MRHKKMIMLPLIGLFLGSCDGLSEDTDVTLNSADLDGKALMENNCYSCHNTQGTGNMLAPPMHRVKDHYWDDETSEKEFVSAIVDWCENPTEETSLMPGARRKFGLMPKQKFDPKEVRAIATYMFHNDLGHAACSHD